MAFHVTGDQMIKLDQRVAEIKRQASNPDGCKIDIGHLLKILQDFIEGKSMTHRFGASPNLGWMVGIADLGLDQPLANQLHEVFGMRTCERLDGLTRADLLSPEFGLSASQVNQIEQKLEERGLRLKTKPATLDTRLEDLPPLIRRQAINRLLEASWVRNLADCVFISAIELMYIRGFGRANTEMLEALLYRHNQQLLREPTESDELRQIGRYRIPIARIVGLKITDLNEFLGTIQISLGYYAVSFSPQELELLAGHGITDAHQLREFKPSELRQLCDNARMSEDECDDFIIRRAAFLSSIGL